MTDDRNDLPPNDPSEASDPTLASSPQETVDSAAAVGRFEPESPGTLIGRYRLVRPLGQGGFGTVHLADQLEPVKRPVALKIIKLGMDTREVIARFEAERQALALMDHPGIAKVFDAGSTESGRPYFVMELVDGAPITAYCDRNRLRTRERLALFAQVCAAVQHAHQKGVIHRDIKPSNVLVTEVEGKPVPKVIDFGIAKATEARLTERTLFTQQAQFIGTPAYMSPEQTGASDLDVDTRSDIYSLGVLLYELLAGVTPFDDASLRSAGFAEIQRIIREDDPPRPSTRVSRLGADLATASELRRLHGAQLVKRLRGELDWIVMKCLEKDRTRRYETANGLAADIGRFLADEPVTASPPSRAYRLRKLVVRNRAVFAAGTAMVLLLAAGVVGTGVGLLRAREAERIAVSEAAKANQVSTFLTDMLAGVGPSAARGRDTEMLEEILQETDAKIGDELADQPEVQGIIRSFVGQTYYDMGRLEQAKAQYEQARDLLLAAGGEPDEDVAKQYSNLGLVHEALQEYDAARENHLEALEIRRAVFPGDHDDLAMNLVNLANLDVNVGRYQEAEPRLREGLAMLRRLHGDRDENVAICLNSLGNLMQHLKRYDEAGPYYEEALASHRSLLGEDHPYVITDLSNIGWLELNTERYEAAAARFEEALALSRRVYTEPHPNLIHAINARANAAMKLEDFETAESLFRESIAVAAELYGPEHAATADQYFELAGCLSAMGRGEESDAEARRAIGIHEKVFGPDDATTLRSRYNYAFAVYDRGDVEASIPLLQAAAAEYTRVNGRDDPQTALALNTLGRAERDAGRLDAAMRDLRESLAIRERVLGPDHLYTGVTLHDLGLAFFMADRAAEADSLFAAAETIYAKTLDPSHRVYGTMGVLRARTALRLGRNDAARELLAAGRPVSLAARGEDHVEQVEYDVLEGLCLARGGERDEAARFAARVEARLEDMEPLKQALVRMNLGAIRASTGAFAKAEKDLLASHAVFAEKFGKDFGLTRRNVAELVDLYERWAAAGSQAAADSAKTWKTRRDGA